jgi:hypothetical protein
LISPETIVEVVVRLKPRCRASDARDLATLFSIAFRTAVVYSPPEKEWTFAVSAFFFILGCIIL